MDYLIDLTDQEILKIYRDFYDKSTISAKAMGISPIEFAHIVVHEFKKKNQNLLDRSNVN